MKNPVVVLIMMAVLALLSACGQEQPDVQGDAPAAWQEQYDLGFRYLSEGNYEQAILAFTAAVEIDPKQPETYLSLADAYMAQGDTESAWAVLEEGLEATDSSDIGARLEELSAQTAVPEPTPTPMPEPTLEVTPEPTLDLTPAPTAEPTAEASVEEDWALLYEEAWYMMDEWGDTVSILHFEENGHGTVDMVALSDGYVITSDNPMDFTVDREKNRVSVSMGGAQIVYDYIPDHKYGPLLLQVVEESLYAGEIQRRVWYLPDGLKTEELREQLYEKERLIYEAN